MSKLTREQMEALKRVYDRGPIYCEVTDSRQAMSGKPLTYRQFRRTAVNGFDCLMVPWCGMWLGIETDGYTHS